MAALKAHHYIKLRSKTFSADIDFFNLTKCQTSLNKLYLSVGTGKAVACLDLRRQCAGYLNLQLVVCSRLGRWMNHSLEWFKCPV